MHTEPTPIDVRDTPLNFLYKTVSMSVFIICNINNITSVKYKSIVKNNIHNIITYLYGKIVYTSHIFLHV